MAVCLFYRNKEHNKQQEADSVVNVTITKVNNKSFCVASNDSGHHVLMYQDAICLEVECQAM